MDDLITKSSYFELHSASRVDLKAFCSKNVKAIEIYPEFNLQITGPL